MPKTILVVDDKANIRNLVCIMVTPDQVAIDFVRADGQVAYSYTIKWQ
jgi:hypothetical protein